MPYNRIKDNDNFYENFGYKIVFIETWIQHKLS